MGRRVGSERQKSRRAVARRVSLVGGFTLAEIFKITAGFSDAPTILQVASAAATAILVAVLTAIGLPAAHPGLKKLRMV